MKLKLDMSRVALCAKLLQESSDGVLSVIVEPYGVPKVEMTEIGFKWAFKDAYNDGLRAVRATEATYYYNKEA